jgi:O-antigen/teichoic acid export membrane protein
MRRSGKDDLIAQLRHFGFGPLIGMWISMLTVPVVTRLVSPEEFGKASLFTLMQTIFNFVVLLGIDQSYVRFYNRKDIDKGNLLFNSLVFPFFTCILVISVVMCFGSTISIFMFGQHEPLIMLSFILFLPALLINRFAMLSIRMDLRGKAYSVLTVAQQLLSFVVLIVLLYIYERTFRSIVLATILSTIFGTLIILLVSKVLTTIRTVYIDRVLLKELLFFGIPLVPASILSWLLNSCDKIALRSYSTFEELGLYAAAFKIVAILSVFQSIFTTTWTPIAYKWYEEKRPNKVFEEISTIVLAVMTFSFSIIIIFRNFIMLFLGAGYRNTTNIFIFLLFVPVLYTVSETTALGIGFSKKTIYTLYVSIITAIANIVGNYFLVPRYGAIGAAISTCICYVIFFWARTLFSRMVWFKFKLWKYLINICLLMGFGVNILVYNSKVIELINFFVIILFNGYLVIFIYRSRKKNQGVICDTI